LNPYLELTNKTDDSKNDNLIANMENWFRLTRDLQLVVTLGANQNTTRRQVFFPDGIGEGYFTKGQASSGQTTTNSYNINGYFLYAKEFNDVHKLNVTLGGEWNKSVLEQLSTTGQGFDLPFFGVNNIGSALQQQIGSYKEDRTIQSLFFRANYTFKDKYVLNTSVRQDGASPFAENKKYGVFPSVGVAWNLSEEDFVKNVGFINNAKLRLSYGKTGSQSISPYSSLARYGNSFYQVGYPATIVTSVAQSSLGNADLTWETTNQINAGLDFNIFNDRLVFSFDYYDKTTDKLLQPRALPSQSGFGSITDNYGKIGNKGIEVSLQADLIRSTDLTFTTRVTATRNRNTLINLGDRKDDQYIGLGGNLFSGTSNILTPGKLIGYFYGYHVTGLAQAKDFTGGVPNYPYPGGPSNQIPGTWLYEDRNGDGKITSADRMILGNSNPDFTYGWTNDITWKNFSLNLFFTGSQGNDVLNVTRFYLNSGLVNYSGVVFNQTEEWYNKRWTAANPTNDIRFPGIQTNIATGDINNTLIENGSYFRLKNLTLSYTFSNLKVIKNPRLFFTGTNLFTITKYSGFDPEVSSYGQSLLQQGIDFGAYPSSKTYTVGLSCTF
ncbi:SusC/RagA family TonB-linked outer membrane protein, partial [Daejeonella sp.]|uniref:SusC/RagA family TonB-linked outer membrane protein n=1 Tax=Daejeonella sp. TaxID=2805397 RepID=UPI0030C5DD7E